jgi:DNA-binding beta-propeller fold protein YncE
MDFPAGIPEIAGDSPSGVWMNFFGRSGLILLAAFILLLELGCGDQYRPVANPIVGPGGQPQSTHYAYVVNNNPGGDSSTMQIDVSGDSVTQLQTTGLGSNFVSFLSTSAAGLFVSNGGDDTVSEFSISQTGVVLTTNLPVGSHPVALSSTQSGVMYVLNSGPNSTCPATGSISVINTSTVAVTSTTCVGVNPIAMVQSPGPGRVFVLNQGDNSILIYDPTSQSIVGKFTTPGNGLGANAVSLASSADGAYIFVVTQGDAVNPGALNIISIDNFSVVPSVPLGVKPTFAYFDPHLVRLYVTNTGSNTVSVFDASNININGSPAMPLLGVTPVGTAPVSVTALPNGTRFFVANSGSNNVTDASATSFAVLNTIPLPTGANPVWIASEPTSSKIYVANQSSISIIQTVNDAIGANIPAPAQNPNCTSSCALQQPVMIITD